MAKKIIAVIVILVALGGVIWQFGIRKGQQTQLPTYFSYTEGELQSLKDLSSQQKITTDDLYIWDERAFEKVEKTKTGDVTASKFYAYLSIAQRDFANISHNKSGAYSGNLSLISKEVFCQFYPADCQFIFTTGDEDSYSQALSQIILKKIKERMLADESQAKPYEAKTGSEYWNGKEPMIGRETGSWKPWVLTSSSQFRVPPGPAYNSPEFLTQLRLTQEALKNVTTEQRDAVVFWAGGPSTKTPPGIWLEIADNYTKEKQLPLEKVLSTRAALTLAMADAFIGCFDSKYTYWVKRPFMMDPTIQTVMPTPNHPSYPAGHACVSSAADVVLSHYLPENEANWNSQAHEAANSRLWGGIHYTIDNEQGFILGTKVGELVVQTMK